jgi:hypothetical protein
MYDTINTGLPMGVGTSCGMTSLTLPYVLELQSYSSITMSEKSGSGVRNLILEYLNPYRYGTMRLARSKCPFQGSEQKDDMVISAVVISNLPRLTAHCREPINDWYCCSTPSLSRSSVS